VHSNAEQTPNYPVKDKKELLNEMRKDKKRGKKKL